MNRQIEDAVAAAPEPLPLVLALLALGVSVLSATLPVLTGRQQRRRDDRATRAEMYVELIEIVEHHGLRVVDRSYDLAESADDDYMTEMPLRRTPSPPRSSRVRARAITSAYASTDVANAFAQWMAALESFERKLDVFAWEAQENGPHSIDVEEALPLRDAEIAARQILADRVNVDLLSGSGLRKGPRGRG